jgi:hypothetical protein
MSFSELIGTMPRRRAARRPSPAPRAAAPAVRTPPRPPAAVRRAAAAGKRSKPKPAQTAGQRALAEWRADPLLQKCWPDAARYAEWRTGNGADRPRNVIVPPRK